MLQLKLEPLDHAVKRGIHGIEHVWKLGWGWSDLRTRAAGRQPVRRLQSAQKRRVVVRPLSYAFHVVTRCSFESSVHVHHVRSCRRVAHRGYEVLSTTRTSARARLQRHEANTTRDSSPQRQRSDGDRSSRSSQSVTTTLLYHGAHVATSAERDKTAQLKMRSIGTNMPPQRGTTHERSGAQKRSK